MEIIIDYNNDKVYIKDDVNNPKDCTFDLKIDRISAVQSLLEEIFNRMNSEFTEAGLGISLSKYDEDNHFGIGEW